MSVERGGTENGKVRLFIKLKCFRRVPFTKCQSTTARHRLIMWSDSVLKKKKNIQIAAMLEHSRGVSASSKKAMPNRLRISRYRKMRPKDYSVILLETALQLAR